MIYERQELVGEYVFARQPILDSEQNVIAYELLYRSHKNSTSALIEQPVMATAQVLVSSLLEKGDTLSDTDKWLFINLSEQALEWVEDWALPKDRVVIELLETIPATSRNLARVSELKKKGYRIALDDYAFDEMTKAFLPLADIVKIDVMNTTRGEIEQVLPELNRYPVTLLAEKVESEEQYRWCMAAGFELFQGYYFAMPEKVTGRTFLSSELQLISLINRLCDPTVEVSELEELIKSDPWLYYRLMRYVSNLCLKKDTQISSVRQAILMVGLVRLKAFIMLMSVTRMAECTDAVIARVFMVAAMSEFMAEEKEGLDGDKGFLVGTFLAISMVLSCSTSQLIAELKLSDDVKRLFVQENNPHQAHNEEVDLNYLDMARCAEQYSRQGCSACAECAAPEISIQRHYEEAIKWSDRLIYSLEEDS